MALINKPAKQIGEGLMLWCGGFGLLILLLARQWHYTQAASPTLPVPNAYDYYVKAGKALVKGTPTIDPVYGKGSYEAALDERLYPLAVKQAWLQQNATALTLIRQGFAYSYWEPPQHSYLPTSSFRELARILMVESHAREQQGDWHGALDSVLDAMRLGHDVARGGPLTSALVSDAIRAISQREMWHILPHLDASTARAAIQRLTVLWEHRMPFADTMAQEKQVGLAHIQAEMGVTNWRRMLSEGLTDEEKKALTPISDNTIVHNYTRLMDVVIANSRRPYKLERPLSPTGDPLTEMFVPIFANARWNAARADADDDILLVTLALQGYHLEHGNYPPSLTDLVPTYLDEVPLDAFGEGEPLHYRVQGDTYVLWSIGPDGVDDGGKPIHAVEANAPNPESAWRVRPDSKGDMVAGINR